MKKCAHWMRIHEGYNRLENRMMIRDNFVLRGCAVLLTFMGMAEWSASMTPLAQSPVPDRLDYGLLFWHQGSRGRDEAGRRLLCIQTGYFGAIFDAEGGHLLRLDAIQNAPDYSAAAAGYNTLIDQLAEASSELEIRVGERVYRNVGSTERWEVRDIEDCPRVPGAGIEPGLTRQNSPANKRYNVRIRDYGHYRQMFDVDRLRFETEDGDVLEATVRLAVTSWPRLLRLALEAVPTVDLMDAQAHLRVTGSGFERSAKSEKATWPRGEIQSLSVTLYFDGEEEPAEAGTLVEATDLTTGEPLTAVYDPTEDAWKVQINNHPYDRDALNGLDRYRVRFANRSGQPRNVQVIFANEMGYNERNLPEEEQGQRMVQSVMGSLLVMRDEAGYPTGARVQNAKNWVHARNVRENTPDLQPWAGLDPVEYGSWHRYTLMARLPPESEWTGEAAVSHALWDGLPQASYYLLSLYGWGFYSFWDVGIQGSFGESTCFALGGYGPCDITDLRPLYVTSYGSTRRPPFEWTSNHGGVNYLHYKTGWRKQYMNVRRVMPTPGPCLSRTEFHGRTEDGKIAFAITVELPRTDDMNRSYHHIRYDVLEDTAFDHLAFLQLGTSLYDYYAPGAIAWGDAHGLQEETEGALPLGVPEYYRQGIRLEGQAPWWVSQHGGRVRGGRGDQGHLSASSRGLVIRHWHAELGGHPVEKPSISFFGTRSPLEGLMVELSPPKGLKYLQKGDFVDMLVEVILVPKHPEHYLGTNEAFRESLQHTADTWKAVHHRAANGAIDLQVHRGELERMFPPRIQVDDTGAAEVSVDGGLAYMPFTFTGVAQSLSPSIYEIRNGVREKVDQSDHGNDFWQADYDPDTGHWAITYNLHLDGISDVAGSRHFVFEAGTDGGDDARYLNAAP